MYEKQVIPKTVPKVPQMSVFEVSVAALLHITGPSDLGGLGD